ncbi:uncharacterized protein Fot_17807 [Forsythia ovata]|uniref:Uncharacterized protein n=1 Tax=Forsythia ovata TaxID=205694 RepID=A0ABD1VGE1_9LAMI
MMVVNRRAEEVVDPSPEITPGKIVHKTLTSKRCQNYPFFKKTGHQQANHLNRDARQTLRSVLLICYVDGTVRLWIETRDGRIRRAEKGSRDQKAPRLFFGVIAVLEVNQTLNKSLGSNVFVCSATKVEGIIATGKEAAIIHM